MKIPYIEPQPSRNKSPRGWRNPKLKRTPPLSVDEAIEAIEQITTNKELAHYLGVPIGQLQYLLYSETNKYKSFNIQKRSGRPRLIESPCSGIKILQYKVKPILDKLYKVKKPVHGFVQNDRNIITNATQHKRKPFILNIDLKDFFHSVNFGRIRGIFKNPPFGFNDSCATILAQLCTYNGRLPQGAPTSPVLSNLAATTLDKYLVTLAHKNHFTYTRYADDITFSSKRIFDRSIVDYTTNEEGKKVIFIGDKLKSLIEKSGFTINEDKTRLQQKYVRQEVTGLVVNEKVNVNRKFIRKTRSMIYQYSIDKEKADEKYLETDKYLSKEKIKKITLDGSHIRNAIYGRLDFIKQIRNNEFSSYLALCKQMLAIDTSPPKSLLYLKDVFDMYDVFICHASEDKNSVALPLYNALQDKGINAFIDCFKIQWGDSLTDKINTALRKSKYVVAIISDASVDKAWPKKEINAVLAAEIRSGSKKLLPLMVGNELELQEKLPLIADKLFHKYENNPEKIAEKLKDLLEK